MNALIDEIYASKIVRDAEGGEHPADYVSLLRADGEALYNAVRDAGPEARSLEIGMAFGLSSLFLCQAHADNGGGEHVAIDPHQQEWFHGIGLLNLERAGLANGFVHCAEPSYRVLPRLLDQGAQFDVIFIDGNHRFEHVLLDWFYSDRLLRTGGRIMIHDSWMPAARKALTFLQRNHAPQYALDEAHLLPPFGLARGVARFLQALRASPLEPAVARCFARKHFPNYFMLRKLRHISDLEYDQAWDFYRSF